MNWSKANMARTRPRGCGGDFQKRVILDDTMCNKQDLPLPVKSSIQKNYIIMWIYSLRKIWLKIAQWLTKKRKALKWHNTILTIFYILLLHPWTGNASFSNSEKYVPFTRLLSLIEHVNDSKLNSNSLSLYFFKSTVFHLTTAAWTPSCLFFQWNTKLLILPMTGLPVLWGSGLD